MYSQLTQWLRENLVQLDQQSHNIGNHVTTLRQQLKQHADFQQQLGSQHASYDATRRYGKFLRDKAPSMDHEQLDEMLREVKNLWQALCNKSLDR
jgi:hypothetical protein